MAQYIEPFLVTHVETLFEMELRLLHTLDDVGGSQYFPDPGLDCYFLREAQEVLRQAIGRVWHLGNEE